MAKGFLYGSGGGLNTKDLAPQVTNLTLTGGDSKIDVSFTGVAAEYTPLVRYYRIIAKAGGIPLSPTDGAWIDIPVISNGGGGNPISYIK